MGKLCHDGGGRQGGSWIDARLAALIDSLNTPDQGVGLRSLSATEIETLWTGWEASAQRSRAGTWTPADAVAPLVAARGEVALTSVVPVAVDPNGGKRRLASRGVWAHLTESGTIAFGLDGPHDDATWAVAELLDAAVKAPVAWRVLLRLRRCAGCKIFFDDANLRRAAQARAFCADKCRDEAQDQAAKERRKRHRAKIAESRAAIDASPGDCVAPELLTLEGHRARVAALRARGLSEERARWVAGEEAAKLERRQTAPGAV